MSLSADGALVNTKATVSLAKHWCDQSLFHLWQNLFLVLFKRSTVKSLEAKPEEVKSQQLRQEVVALHSSSLLFSSDAYEIYEKLP